MNIPDIRYFRRQKEPDTLQEYKKKAQEQLKKEILEKYPDAEIKDNYFKGSCNTGYFYGPLSNPIGLLVKFPNQYGASIVRHSGSYGGPDGLLEMGVAIFSGELYGLDYNTPLTDDVFGYLEEDELFEKLGLVSELPSHVRGE